MKTLIKVLKQHICDKKIISHFLYIKQNKNVFSFEEKNKMLIGREKNYNTR